MLSVNIFMKETLRNFLLHFIVFFFSGGHSRNYLKNTLKVERIETSKLRNF